MHLQIQNQSCVKCVMAWRSWDTFRNSPFWEVLGWESGHIFLVVLTLLWLFSAEVKFLRTKKKRRKYTENLSPSNTSTNSRSRKESWKHIIREVAQEWYIRRWAKWCRELLNSPQSGKGKRETELCVWSVLCSEHTDALGNRGRFETYEHSQRLVFFLHEMLSWMLIKKNNLNAK